MKIETAVLSSGLRVVHVPDQHAKVAHCGFIFNVGSRDEAEDEHGLAHFLEHVLFKGTKKRKVHHVLNRMEVVGGEINAHTTKEDISVYSSFLTEYYPRAIELLTDICFHSVFLPKEIEKEKEVILDEVKSYLDNPYELIFEEFDSYLIPKHALGRPILGTPESIRAIDRKAILAFVQKHFHPEDMVFTSVGNISMEKLKKILEKHIDHTPFSKKQYKRNKLRNVHTFTHKLQKKTHQSHVLLGCQTQSVFSHKTTHISLLNNLLGGPNMNSLLNLSLREKMGLTYHTESSYTPFTDLGIFNIYIGTDEKNIDKAIDGIYKECDLLSKNKITNTKLEQYKKQFLGQCMMGLENRANLMLALGKSFLLHDKIETIEALERKVLQVTSAQMHDCIDQVLDYHNFSTLIYTPIQE